MVIFCVFDLSRSARFVPIRSVGPGYELCDAIYHVAIAFDTKQVSYRMADGPWWVRKWWSFAVRKGNYAFLFIENRVAKLVKYSFGPTSCLAASLAEFELFIHELCRFALSHAKIPVNMWTDSRSHSTKSMFKVTRSVIIHRFLMAEFPMQKLQARTQGGALGARAPPPPPNLGKKFRSEMSKRGEKVPPRYLGKKECARSAQIRQN